MSSAALRARAHELFQRVVELEPCGRAALLHEECVADPELRALVDALLRADDEEHTLLDADALVLVDLLEDDQDDVALPYGGRIDDYHLLAEAGRGGMATVYLAEREVAHVRQRVALKLVKRGIDTDEVLRRFAHETRVLASLEHPHIARFHDVGVSPDGRPYLVMEYIEGLPVTAYCDAHRLGIDARLALFRTVCSAVQYAHQRLVVHRDIKPSNILVTVAGQVKLLDFGIAKPLSDEPDDAAPHTRTGVFVLTPEYAAPEQLTGGPISTATDVYALALVLYELLAGARPRPAPVSLNPGTRGDVPPEQPAPSTAVRRDARDGAAASIATLRATTPDRLRRRLSGDLDRIVLKALAHAPSQRYATARELEEDIGRLQSGLPVHARPPSATYRAARFVARHRVGVAVAALVAALGIGFLAAMTRAQAETARALERARAEADKATEVTDFLVGLFRASDPNERALAELSVRDLLERGGARVAGELSDHPETRAELMATLGIIHIELGLYDRAGALLRQSLALRRELFGSHHVDVASSLYNLGNLHYRQGRYDSAQALLAQALQLRRALLPEEHPALIRNLNGLAVLLYLQGHLDEAEPLYRQSLELRRRVSGNEHPEIAQTLNNLSALAGARGDFAAAEQYARESFELRRALLGEEHPAVANSMHNVAILMRNRGDLRGADSLLRRTLAVRRRIFGEPHPDVARNLFALGEVERRFGRRDAAGRLLHEALAMQRATLGDDHPETALTLEHLARTRHDEGEHAAADTLYRDAIERMTAALGAAHSNVASVGVGLGACLSARGRFAEAEEWLLKAYRHGAAEDREQARVELVSLYLAWGKPDEAARYQARPADRT